MKTYDFIIHHSDVHWGSVSSKNFGSELIEANTHDDALKKAHHLAAGLDGVDWPLDQFSECDVWEVLS
jgi:hypothetical protein